ncbi:hypothetical protein LTR09_010696 [Extremus antarcticus]|uniref:Glutathione S-transferase n=1 Tax=Extremus antarcticus TaxID=702011 RepID=A0AAJ0DDA4_9PEZI|nr:hypothetical protein LTR09_010696 [Extremus antarcticus]
MSQPRYELYYHPGIPGRLEHVRLLLEASGTPYTEIARDQKDGYSTVQKICMGKAPESVDGNPPMFAPPALRVTNGGSGNGKSLMISQTPNILAYLGEKTGMDGGEEMKWWVQQVALTALDLNNEVHNSHHPVSIGAFYEQQREEALRNAKDVREMRFPKYFGYFERMLEWNKEARQGKYLVGKGLTYADTTVWQVLDGCFFAFPREMEVRRKEFPGMLGEFYEGVKSAKGLKEYLASERRLPYSMGIFRHYPELDRQ